MTPVQTPIPLDEIHNGHRERMRKKLLRHGADVFDTYELLEMLLYYTLPMRDTNPVAKALLAGFGGLDGVFRASREELLSISGVGEKSADLILAFGGFSAAASLPRADGEDDFSDYRRAAEYFVGYFRGRSDYAVAMMSLDNRMRLLGVDELCPLDFASAGVRPALYIDAAVKRRASVVIFAHNHPHGPLFLSDGDRAANALFLSAFQGTDVLIAEHFVVSGEHAVGTLARARTGFSQYVALDSFYESVRETGGGVSPDLTENAGIDDAKSKELFTKEETETERFLTELFLHAKKSRAEAKALTDALLGKLRTADRVFEAPPEMLIGIPGVGESDAVLVRLAVALFARRTIDGFRFGRRHTEEEITGLLRALLLGRANETVLLLSLDEKGKVLGADPVGGGVVSASVVLPRQILDVALGRGAKEVLLAHNHPGGSVRASNEDVAMARELARTLGDAGVLLRRQFVFSGFDFEVYLIE